MSTEPAGRIYALIPKVMKDIGAIGKDRKNDQQGYKFRGIEDMYNAANPALVAHGVFCVPQVTKYEQQDRVSKSGTPSIRVVLTVCHRFYADDGSFVEAVTIGEGIDTSDKASNKAMSAAMKYAMIETFSIPTEDMEDSDRTTPEVGVKPLNVPRTEAAIPISKPANGNGKNGVTTEPPPEDQRIDSAQQKKLHMRFREALSDDLKPKADAILHDFLGKKLCLDENGNPSAKGILKTEFAAIGTEAVAFAKEISA